jgi:Uma2 family endonuclease
MRIVSNNGRIEFPPWVVDQDSYRRWAKSDDFPERGDIFYLDGLFWVDLSMEEIKHNLIKGKYAATLTFVIDQADSGYYIGDNMLITNVKASLSTEPDGSFVSHEALRTGRVLLREGDKSLEIEGSPDMTLEVISPTSVEKDTEILPKLYWRARVREYWLVDPRGEIATFDILLRGPRRYVPARKSGGWVKSEVFGKSFRLTQRPGKHGLTEYRVEVR